MTLARRRAATGLLTVAAALALTACSSASTADGGSSGATTAGSSATTTELTYAVADGKVTPPTSTVTVPKGRTIRLTVTSDHVDEVHVHGIDEEMELPTPGTPGTLVFTASLTGSFEVETHKTDLLLFKLDVTG
ncbi:hypothetical protein CLV35_1981 [Motilibacter peucedani]|uniref:EfeO-type cupredoxin-like domain-containing protein n=1 Tax=Motilibacter peucedani TaxID=598650 RepID=A0A420XQD5_9ACTN|nr:hypothetical protein [Motilibacter peucedani]RKS75511.1 hypothetical protein CLV35_1981 [Motilibacter peucedani]